MLQVKLGTTLPFGRNAGSITDRFFSEPFSVKLIEMDSKDCHLDTSQCRVTGACQPKVVIILKTTLESLSGVVAIKVLRLIGLHCGVFATCAAVTYTPIIGECSQMYCL